MQTPRCHDPDSGSSKWTSPSFRWVSRNPKNLQGDLTFFLDFLIFQDDDLFYDENSISSSHSTAATHQHHPHFAEMHRCSQPKMPPYPFGGYMVPSQARQDCRETASLMRPRRTSEYPILARIMQHMSVYL